MKKIFLVITAILLTIMSLTPVFCAEDNIVTLNEGQTIVSEGNSTADSELSKDYVVITEVDKQFSIAVKKGNGIAIPQGGRYKIKGEYKIK